MSKVYVVLKWHLLYKMHIGTESRFFCFRTHMGGAEKRVPRAVDIASTRRDLRDFASTLQEGVSAI